MAPVLGGCIATVPAQGQAQDGRANPSLYRWLHALPALGGGTATVPAGEQVGMLMMSTQKPLHDSARDGSRPGRQDP